MNDWRRSVADQAERRSNERFEHGLDSGCIPGRRFTRRHVAARLVDIARGASGPGSTASTAPDRALRGPTSALLTRRLHAASVAVR